MFVVVGVAVAILSVCIFVVVRRRQRINRRRRIRSGITRPFPFPDDPLPRDPFEDPRNPPLTRTANLDREDMNWGGRRRAMLEDEVVGSTVSPNAPDTKSEGYGFTGIGAGGNFGQQAHYDPPFSDYHAYLQAPVPPIGLAVTTEQQEISRSRASTPSVYPPSLPPAGGEPVDSFYQQEMSIAPKPPGWVPIAPSRPPPVQPRSPLRPVPSKILEYHPMTPPDSIASGSQTSSPTSEIPAANLIPDGNPHDGRFDTLLQAKQEGVLARRTLLDVCILFSSINQRT